MLNSSLNGRENQDWCPTHPERYYKNKKALFTVRNRSIGQIVGQCKYYTKQAVQRGGYGRETNGKTSIWRPVESKLQHKDGVKQLTRKNVYYAFQDNGMFAYVIMNFLWELLYHRYYKFDITTLKLTNYKVATLKLTKIIYWNYI